MNVKFEEKIVARGIWYYDSVTAKEIIVYSRLAKYAPSRFNDMDELDEASEIPKTNDGLIYVVSGKGFSTLKDAKDWANSQPWGPVKWVDL